MADRLDTMLREYVELSPHELFGDDESVDAFIGGDLLDAVDRAALHRSRRRWPTEPTDYCRVESAHERRDYHAPHAVYPDGEHDHALGARERGKHPHEMPF